MFETIHGYFLTTGTPWFVLGSVLVILALGFTGAPLIAWTLALAAILIGFGVHPIALYVFAGVAVIFNLTPLRRILITSGLMKVMKGVMPKISETERVALDAGVVWVEKDLFSGKPDFKKIKSEPYPDLTAEEQAFMDGPVNRLCDVIDEWKVWNERELPQAAWDIIKKERFLGMIIPKKYGGLEFSALAHSAVIKKLASRTAPGCITVMVPNSLGPAELINHYGTEAQKAHLLPKLAVGEEIPCFALTEPTAGSDAGSLTSNGILFKGPDGKLKIKLNWDKRWITLAAISTTLGLAFRLKDPENLLGKGVDVGITCGLIPSKTPGVVLGRRHDPLGVPFYNCPTQGHDVIVDAEDAIVGGLNGAGKGWMMLMECLAAGRGISLPAQSVGIGELATRVTSAHGVIRKQFGMSIGKFEGVEEPMARIAGFTYLMEAARKFVCGALDQGLKPPVITAIAKYNQTELSRKIVNDAMDIMGGCGISQGPRNLIAGAYITNPISITVEGANIMTRTLIIFGQGALRAHPYAYKEVSTIEKGDVKGFDQAFWGHIGHVVRNTFRSVLLSLTRGWLAGSPVSGPTAKYYRKLSWASATFAIMSDIAMGSLGGTLKFREKITGRFADVLSWMFLATATLRRFEAEGSKKEDLPFVHFAMQHALAQMQLGFDGIFKNIGVPGLGWLFAGIVGWWGRLNSFGDGPSDKITHEVSSLIQQDSTQRDRFCAGIFHPTREGEALKRLDDTMKAVKRAEAIEKKVRKAVQEKKISKGPVAQLLKEALEKGVLTEMEVTELKKAEALRYDAILVDSFTQEEYLSRGKTGASAELKQAA